jgi:hypothetical protein
MRRLDVFVYVLIAKQTVSALTAMVALALGHGVNQTGWVQTVGIFAAGVVSLDGVTACIGRASKVTEGSYAVFIDLLTGIAVVVGLVGVIALVCDSEHERHAVEGAACALIVAWGTVFARAGTRFVECDVAPKSQLSYDIQL